MERDADRFGSRELAHQLLEAIDAGKYGVDEKLPSYRDLAREHRIAVGTAREALRLLEQYGRVVIRHGSGAFVVSPETGDSTEEQLKALQGELEELRGQLRRTGDALAASEDRLAAIVDRVGRLQ